MHVLTLWTKSTGHEVIVKDGKLFFNNQPVTKIEIRELPEE